jgi:iron complex transport system substrate-binding protein
MKTKAASFILAAIMCLSLSACWRTSSDNNTSNPPKQSVVITPAPDETSVVSSEPRTIIDLAGNEVKIPAVSKIQRVVITSGPVMSFVVRTIPDTKMIVGINSRAFTTSNSKITGKVFPNWQIVDTSFIGASFAVNAESLLTLNPDIIFYYGNVQKQGLGKISIPSIDFHSSLYDPEMVSVAWDNLLREIFGLNSSGSQQENWNRTNERLSELLENQTETKTALCIFSNAAGTITVSGTDSFDAYAQSFFYKAGIQNIAAGVKGTAEVSMEQIYEWNPDMIIVFQDVPAKSIMDNSIKGQDWSLLDAWKNGDIYDVPRTTYSWITPCADSPLLPLWLVSKAYPDLFSEEEMRTEIVEYYQRNYEIDLTESDLVSILGYREASGS